MSEESVKKTIDIAQAGGKEPEADVKKARGAFSKLKRDLTDSDLKNPAVGRLLLNQIDSQEQEVNSLKEYKEKYHDADKRAEVVAERLCGVEQSAIGRSVFLTLGGLAAGFLPSLWETKNWFITVILIAITLFAIGIFKPIRRK